MYADIDTGAVGVPLEESAGSDDDDDFMYIEGIIDYTKKTWKVLSFLLNQVEII